MYNQLLDKHNFLFVIFSVTITSFVMEHLQREKNVLFKCHIYDNIYYNIRLQHYVFTTYMISRACY